MQLEVSVRSERNRTMSLSWKAVRSINVQHCKNCSVYIHTVHACRVVPIDYPLSPPSSLCCILAFRNWWIIFCYPFTACALGSPLQHFDWGSEQHGHQPATRCLLQLFRFGRSGKWEELNLVVLLSYVWRN